jgi:hypothetical protein
VTDDEVVKVLAGFMGYKFDRVLPPHEGGSAYMLKGAGVPAPDYLTSYDAIAEVWRKMRDSMPDTHDPFVNPACMYCVACEQLTDACWFGNEPRDHAHALAKAISQSKGE